MLKPKTHPKKGVFFIVHFSLIKIILALIFILLFSYKNIFSSSFAIDKNRSCVMILIIKTRGL